MSSDVHYHTQPHTLDPTKEPPENVEDVPLAQGHDEGMSEDVRDAQVEHREQVQAERDARDEAAEAGEPEPGAPRAPGDHAGSDEADEGGASSDAVEGSDEPQSEGDCPPAGTVDDVLSWVGDDHERAQSALAAERDGQNRSSLITKLEAI